MEADRCQWFRSDEPFQVSAYAVIACRRGMRNSPDVLIWPSRSDDQHESFALLATELAVAKIESLH